MERVFSFSPIKARARHLAGVFFLVTCLFCPCTGWSWEIIGSVKDDAGNPIAGIPVSGYGRADNTNGYAHAVTAQDGGCGAVPPHHPREQIEDGGRGRPGAEFPYAHSGSTPTSALVEANTFSPSFTLSYRSSIDVPACPNQ